MSTTLSSLSAGSSEIAGFVKLSAQLGAAPLLIQASGGNTSIKEDNILWVKASGKVLADAEVEDIFVAVELEGVREAVAHNETDPVSAYVATETALRPSIETTLHALLPHRVVLHVHSVNALRWTVRVDGKDRVAEKMQGLNWVWVPYCRPGVPLTRGVEKAAGSNPDILVLGNHGLVVGGDSVVEAEARLRETEARLTGPRRGQPSAAFGKLAAAIGDAPYVAAEGDTAHALAIDAFALENARGGPLYPDHVVFLGPEAPVAENGRTVAAVADDYKARYGENPAYVIVEGAGVAVRSERPFGVEAMLTCQADVLLRIDTDASLNFLNATEIAELMNWDAEKYRRTLNP